MKRLCLLSLCLLTLSGHAYSKDKTDGKKDSVPSYQEGGKRYWQAAVVELEALKLPQDSKRLHLLRTAIELRKSAAWLKYAYGKASPEQGGFDCSGAVYYVLRKAGIKNCPRTSAQQYDWVKKLGNLKVAPDGKDYTLDDDFFDALKPGDLLFWGKTYQPTDGRTNGVTHVEIYLGKEKKDGHRVMIGSSKGRSYRGKRSDGYGVVDFKLPSKRTKTVFMGYGSPDLSKISVPKEAKAKKKVVTGCDCQCKCKDCQCAE